jgi:hypothetical protein
MMAHVSDVYADDTVILELVEEISQSCQSAQRLFFNKIVLLANNFYTL